MKKNRSICHFCEKFEFKEGVMKFSTTFVCSLVSLVSHIVIAKEDNTENKVISILSEEQFYDIVNKGNGKFTTTFNLVKYYTTWCSHCKRLNPVFKDLSVKYGASSQFNFLEVDCDIFGSNLCKKLPGYPMIEVVTTDTNDINNILEEPVKDERFWWQRIWSPQRDPTWTINDDRIIQYKGSRDFESISNFIERLINMDKLQIQIQKIIQGLDTQSELSQFYDECLKKYITFLDKKNYIYTLDNEKLEEERSRLEDIFNQGSDSEKESWTKQLWFINWLVDKQMATDELNNNSKHDEL